MKKEKGVTSNCYSCLLLLPIDNLEWCHHNNSFVASPGTTNKVYHMIYRTHKVDCVPHLSYLALKTSRRF